MPPVQMCGHWFPLVLMFVCTALMIGCGGGSEDFSKPPAAIANKKPVETEPAKANSPVANAALLLVGAGLLITPHHAGPCMRC